MKKIITYYALFILLTMGLSAKAAVVMVEVENFEFNPAIFTVNVGDTIMWMWDEGSHTTTSSTIPAGASPWDQPITQSSPMYMYIVTVAGSYDYMCVPHSSMNMLGHFTALSVTGLNESPSLSFLTVKGNNPSAEELVVSYGLPASSVVTLTVYDIIGNSVQTRNLSMQHAGVYEQVISTAALPKGIYIVELAAGQSRVSHKVMIQ